MNELEKIIAHEEELAESLSKDIKSLQARLAASRKRKDKAFLKLNEQNLKDIAWLIKNPEKPGVYEATNKIITDLYGSEWAGVHPSGYMHDGKYNPIQQNYDFSLKDYYDGKNREEYIRNCKHFVENYIDYFDAHVEAEPGYNRDFSPCKVVGFQVLSEESGLTYLGYEPIEKVWYLFTIVYSRIRLERKFKDFDEAINYAYEIANKEVVEDEDDY